MGDISDQYDCPCGGYWRGELREEGLRDAAALIEAIAKDDHEGYMTVRRHTTHAVDALIEIVIRASGAEPVCFGCFVAEIRTAAEEKRGLDFTSRHDDD